LSYGCNDQAFLLPFPQQFRDGTLELNFVVLPRNQNRCDGDRSHATIPDAPAFADAKLLFEAHIVSSLAASEQSFREQGHRRAGRAPPNARALFERLKAIFRLNRR